MTHVERPPLSRAFSPNGIFRLVHPGRCLGYLVTPRLGLNLARFPTYSMHPLTSYWDLFTGAFGHTYGHHSVWQMWKEGNKGTNDPLLPWSEAIEQNGASQMQHGRALIESRPFFTRIPDQDILVNDRVKTSVPGAGRYQFVATRDTDGTTPWSMRPWVGHSKSKWM